MAADEHRPVLFDEALAALNIRAEGRYLDATFGRGGHSAGILARLGPTGRLVALDRDPAAVVVARERFGDDARFTIRQANFAEIDTMPMAQSGFDGILMDLGVSSPQLDQPERGFSFRADGPLDMRMDTTRGETAAEFLRRVSERELKRILKEYGEERYAGRVASAIVRAARQGALETTAQLASVVRSAIPGRSGDKDKATRSFQAIRIAVNREMEALAAGLEKLVQRLDAGARLVVITFHSLEDRMVKQTFRRLSSPPDLPRKLPVRGAEFTPAFGVVGKPVRPSEAELSANPRARSATLRVLEKRA